MNCCKCKIILDENNAYFRKTENRFHNFCKSCFNEYCKNRWLNRKKEAIKLKGGKCEICGYNKYYGALEFHHRKPEEKEFDWKKYRQMSLEKLNKELGKCNLLCSNCHKEIHGGVSVLTSNQ